MSAQSALGFLLSPVPAEVPALCDRIRQLEAAIALVGDGAGELLDAEAVLLVTLTSLRPDDLAGVIQKLETATRRIEQSGGFASPVIIALLEATAEDIRVLNRIKRARQILG